MTERIEIYYDFRSPYAYFANHRIRKGQLKFSEGVEWVGRPIFIDVILNLQSGREVWAPYVDTLIPPKRAYLMADIRRMAQYYAAPLKPSWKWPAKPNQIPALCVASLLAGEVEETFRDAVFNGMWHEQRDVADSGFLMEALKRAGADAALLDQAKDPVVQDALTKRTVEAYAKGVFGTPAFVWNDQIFFGADRLEVLAWMVNQKGIAPLGGRGFVSSF